MNIQMMVAVYAALILYHLTQQMENRYNQWKYSRQFGNQTASIPIVPQPNGEWRECNVEIALIKYRSISDNTIWKYELNTSKQKYINNNMFEFVDLRGQRLIWPIHRLQFYDIDGKIIDIFDIIEKSPPPR